MAAPFIQPSFSRGEIAPALWGRIDLAAWHTAATTLRNMYVGFRGGVYSRAGTRYVGRSKQNPTNGDPAPRLIKFAFSATQQYVLEFGEQYLRIITRAGFATEAAFALSAVAQSFPCLVTAPGHNFADGDWVSFDSQVSGMVELRGNTYIVADSDIAGGTFTLEDLDGFAISSLAYGVYTGGGTVARIYTVPTPYAASDLKRLKFTQSADTISLTHPSYPPQELKRFGPVNWTMTPADFGAPILPPASLTATATVHPDAGSSPPTLPAAYAYVVTAIDPATGAESIASPVANVVDSIDMAVTAGSIMLVWEPVPGALFYNLYRSPASYNTGDASTAKPVPAGALMGFVGSAFGTEFVDNNIIPDFAHTPPLHQDPFAPGKILAITMTGSNSDWTVATASIASATGSGFSGQCVISGGAVVAVIIIDGGAQYLAGDALVITGDGTGATGTLDIGPQLGTYPGGVSYFQQRRDYFNSLNSPATYWLSQPGAYTNFDSSIPVTDSDAIASTLTSGSIDGIEWMVTVPTGLLTFTAGGIWLVGAPGAFAANPEAVTPANQGATPQSNIGSSGTLRPIQVNWDILYLPPQATTVRALTYQVAFNTFTASDISWPSSHLLRGHPIVAWAYCEEPYRIVWACRDDGMLLSMTYLKEQEVIGWAAHVTFGQVRDLCSVGELPQDALYLVVQRGVIIAGDGSHPDRFFIERMDDRLWNSAEDTWGVDAGVGTDVEFPNATISYEAESGDSVPVLMSPGVADPSWVGRTLRAGGGVARIASYGGPGQIRIDWLYPAGTPFNQPPGTWSIGVQVTRLGGLLHLASQPVVGVADGVPIGPLNVSVTGFVDLPFAASKVILGLPFTVQGQSIHLDAGSPTVQGRRKTIPGVTLRIEGSAPMQVGSNQRDASAQSPPPLSVGWEGLTRAVPADGPWPAPYQNAGGESVQPLFTGDVAVLVPSVWGKPGQVAWQQTLPLPLAVLAIIPDFLPGDEPEVSYSQRRAPQQERVRG